MDKSSLHPLVDSKVSAISYNRNILNLIDIEPKTRCCEKAQGFTQELKQKIEDSGILKDQTRKERKLLLDTKSGGLVREVA